MDLKKIMATVGVAAAVLTVNAQSWKSNSYGLYSYPLTGNTSNVTIGTTPSSTTANYKLFVDGSAYVKGNTMLYGNLNVAGMSNKIQHGLDIFTGSSDNSSNRLRILTGSVSSSNISLAACGYQNYVGMEYKAYYHYFFNATKKMMTIGPSNIEISSPVDVQSSLDVTGKITCHNEIEVADLLKANQIKAGDINVELNNAADYVFDENYDLKSLSEVENYVKENKHLPGVPSASEIAENGMSVSQMSNLFLEKIEELTLHMIELQKENKALKAEVESLKK